MTKKDFSKLISFHNYGRDRDSSLKAIFFDWKSGDIDEMYFGGFKYCVFTRSTNATKAELVNALYDLITKEKNTEWYIQSIVAQNDLQRFKVPIMGSGLTTLIKYEKV